MAANTAPLFELTPVIKGTQFTSSDTTTKKTLLTGGTYGTRIDGIVIATNDTTAVNLAFYVNDGSTDYYLGVVAVAIGSGYTTVPRIDGLVTLGLTNTSVLVLPPSYTLKAACVATMTSAKTTDVTVHGGDF